MICSELELTETNDNSVIDRTRLPASLNIATASAIHFNARFLQQVRMRLQRTTISLIDNFILVFSDKSNSSPVL